ncbi:MAG: hypothetical protein ABIH23_32275, partial [bacterium]
QQTSDEFNPEMLEFYGAGEDIFRMIRYLAALKSEFPDSSAMEDVFAHLKESRRRPLAIRIAKALCLAADGHNDEAISLLNELEEILVQEKSAQQKKYPSDHDELKDIPLYVSGILFLEGRDYNAARAAFQEFFERNRDNPKLVIERALKLISTMERAPGVGCRQFAELTGFLIESELFTNKEFQDPSLLNRVTETHLSDLLERHQMSLAWRGQWDESAQVCLQIMNEYPNTSAAAYAVIYFSSYLSRRSEDMDDGTERLIQSILADPPDEYVIPYLEILLGERAVKRGDCAKALTLAEDALDRLGPTPQGSLRGWQNRALGLRSHASKSTDASSR